MDPSDLKDIVRVLARAIMRISRRAAVLLGILLALGSHAACADQTVRVGVLDLRGAEATLARWQPTADYLTGTLPGHRFVAVPLDHAHMSDAVARGEVDFVLTDPASYVELEAEFGITRIATLVNSCAEIPCARFGAVLFTRADRRDIGGIDDLRGKTLIGADRASLGGFLLAWRELKAHGIDPDRDLAGVTFSHDQNKAVRAVLARLADVGTVRTGVLEDMARRGEIDLAAIKIIAPNAHAGFPLLLSTPLYPEWPFARLARTPDDLAQRVAVALLTLSPTEPAARAGGYDHWTIPLDYRSSVVELFRELNIGPYRHRTPPLLDTLRDRWRTVALVALLMLALAATGAGLYRANHRLARLGRDCEQKMQALEQADATIRDRQFWLDDITAALGDGVYALDVDGNITFANPAAQALVGWSDMELLGQNAHVLLHHHRADGADHPAEQCPIQRALRAGKTFRSDDELFWRKDGGHLPVSVVAAPIFRAGELVGSVASFHDLSDVKAAQRKTEETERRLAGLVSAASHGILLEDSEHRTVLANQAFRDLVGNEPVPAPPAGGLTHLLRDPEASASRIEQIVLERRVVTGEQLVLKDGRTLSRDYAPIEMDGRPCCHLWQYRDVTPVRRNDDGA